MRSGVHEDDKRVIKSVRESRSGRGGGASEGVVGDMNVEGGNRGPAVPIVSDYWSHKKYLVWEMEREKSKIPGCMEEIE